MPKSPEREHKERRIPESLRLRRLEPSFTVNDVERSLAFYRDVLGFTVKDRWEEGGKVLGAVLVAGAVSIGISQDDFSKGRDRVKGLGFRLWTFTVQDLEALATAIRARGGKVDGPADLPWGGRALTVTDPDGYKLSIAEEQE